MGKKISGVIYPWGYFPRGKFSWEHLSKRQLCRQQIIRRAIILGSNLKGLLSGSSYLWGNFPQAIIWWQSFMGQLSVGGEQFFSGVIILGGNFPRCIYLFLSKHTEMHITTKTNETNTKIKSFEKARCCHHCNGKVIYTDTHMNIYTYGPGKNALNVTKSQQIKGLLILSLYLSFCHYIVLKCL